MDSTESLPALPVTFFRETFGIPLIFLMLGLILAGISAVQAYLYYPSKDSFKVQSMVAVVLILGFTHTALACHSTYRNLILGYTQPSILVNNSWALYASDLLAIMAIIIVQLFFIHTVYEFVTKKRPRVILVGVLLALGLLQTSYGIYSITRVIEVGQFQLLVDIVRPCILPMYVARAVSDAITSVVFCHSLYESRLGYGRILKLVRVPIVYGINGFLIATALTWTQMIIVASRPEKLFATQIDFVTVHLYANSLMATLNARARWGSALESEDEDSDHWKTRRPSVVHLQGPGRKHLHVNSTRAARVGANSSTKSSFASDIAGEDLKVPSNSYKGKKGRFGDVNMDVIVEAETIVMKDIPVQMY